MGAVQVVTREPHRPPHGERAAVRGHRAPRCYEDKQRLGSTIATGRRRAVRDLARGQGHSPAAAPRTTTNSLVSCNLTAGVACGFDQK